MPMLDNKKDNLKSYSDTYLYKTYPNYQKVLFDALMKDPVIDKSTEAFKDVIYEVKRSKLLSESLIRILNSTNTVLLDPVKPLPRSFKVFASRDPKDRKKPMRVFIDCTNVLVMDSGSNSYTIDDVKLISYLIQAAVDMVYHRNYTLITRRSNLLHAATSCFAKLFTHIIDYLTKISIQESSKIKVLYLSAMYFLEGVLIMDDPAGSARLAKKIAGISERESNMLDILLDKATHQNGIRESEVDAYGDIRTFVRVLADVMHLNPRVITTDIVVEKWMKQYGHGTVMGIEYFPAFSAMLTDAYNGGYLNQQKTIEKVCGADMVEYGKEIINLIGNIV